MKGSSWIARCVQVLVVGILIVGLLPVNRVAAQAALALPPTPIAEQATSTPVATPTVTPSATPSVTATATLDPTATTATVASPTATGTLGPMPTEMTAGPTSAAAPTATASATPAQNARSAPATPAPSQEERQRNRREGATSRPAIDTSAVVPDRLIVTIKRGASRFREATAHAAAKGRVVREVDRIGVRVVEIDPGKREEAIRAYRSSPDVLAVEPDRVRVAADIPNDPRYPEQWALPKVQAPEAWDVTTGSSSVRIAILDCGIFSPSSAWGDQNSFPNGHPDVGPKVMLEQDFSGSGNTDDFCNHGTHVAGIAAAVTSNALGVAGVATEAVLLNGKVLGDDGSGTESMEIQGIIWAADNGARVINLSLGAQGDCSTAEQEAIDYAWSKGAVVVAAAGNSGRQGATAPANCDKVIAVGATGSNDARASFSNYGSNVDLAAPGVSILSTNYLGSYESLSGTSMATPMVSGLAALIWATGWGVSNQAVVDRLILHADAVSGTGSTWQYGRINAKRAVGIDSTDMPAVVNDGTGQDLTHTASSTTLSANWSSVEGAAGYEYAIGTTPGGAEVSAYTAVGNATSVTRSGLGLADGTTYYVSVRAYDVAGNRSNARSSNGVVVAVELAVDGVSDSPDPFSPNGDAVKDATTISYSLSKTATVSLQVFGDACGGTLVRTLVYAQSRNGGANTELWDGMDGGETPAAVPDGSYVYCIDVSDDTDPGVRAEGTVMVDTQAPDTTITSGPQAASVINTATAVFEFTSTESGSSFACSLDAAPFTECTSPATYSVGQGAHSFQVKATDAAGNTDLVPASRAWTVDTVPPTITISGGETVSTTSSMPSLSGTTNATDGSSVAVDLNGRTYTTAATGGSWNVTVPSSDVLEDGTYVVRATVSDAAGNEGNDTQNLVVDTVPPSVSLTVRTNAGVTNATTPTFSASASDGLGSGIASVQFQIRAASVADWSDVSGADTDEPFAADMTTALAEGAYLARAAATDQAGNQATSTEVQLEVDVTPPDHPVVLAPAAPATVDATTYGITGTAEANALVRVWQASNGAKSSGASAVGSQQLASGATDFAVSVPLTQDAANTFVVTATDAAGNESAVAVVPTITEDSPDPAPNSSSGDGGSDGGSSGSGSSGGGSSGGSSGGGGGSSGGGGSASSSTTTQAATPEVSSTAEPTPTVQPAPTGEPTPTIESGALALGAPIRELIPPSGGALGAASGQVELRVPAEATSGSELDLSLVELVPSSIPSSESGFMIGERAFQITATNRATGQAVTEFPAPLVLTYQPTAAELEAAGGIQNIRIASWDGSQWVAASCVVDTGGATLSCTIPHLTVFAVLIVSSAMGPQEMALTNGRFYKQTNGFSGAGERGYAVIDDARAKFWTEFQRLGGVDRVGYPVTGRFVHKGFLTQAFQKLALQWRPELGRAVPVNVFDDLAEQGADAWLDAFRQVPPAADTAPDQGLAWEQVVSRHVSFLDAYPELKGFYLSDPDWLESYGLPLAVKDYGPFVGVRLQRATLQLWKVDVPWARAGTVVVGNGSDLAKEAGLWPEHAVAPELASNYSEGQRPGGGDRQAVVDLAVADAAQRLGMDPPAVSVLRVEPREWSDASLGCPRPDQWYAQVIIPGYLVVLQIGGVRLEYHTDLERRIVLCSTEGG